MFSVIWDKVFQKGANRGIPGKSIYWYVDFSTINIVAGCVIVSSRPSHVAPLRAPYLFKNN